MQLHLPTPFVGGFHDHYTKCRLELRALDILVEQDTEKKE
jgi:hypothetical protein